MSSHTDIAIPITFGKRTFSFSVLRI